MLPTETLRAEEIDYKLQADGARLALTDLVQAAQRNVEFCERELGRDVMDDPDKSHVSARDAVTKARAALNALENADRAIRPYLTGSKRHVPERRP